MAETGKRRFYALIGYELQTFDEALAVQLSYGKPGVAPGPKDRRTPTLFLMPDEARELARDLIAAADKIESSNEPAPDAPLH